MRIMDVSDDDAEYDRAFKRARASLDRLELLWSEPYQGTRTFMFKVCITGVRRPIFQWLELTQVSNTHYHGAVFETTDEIPTMTEGQILEVEKALALDWLVNDNGTIHGGFTLLAERQKLTPQQVSELDDQLMATCWVDGPDGE